MADIVLNWTAPTANCDGSAVRPAINYFVEYGKPHDAISKQEVGTALGVTLTGLDAAEYRCRVTARDALGYISQPSGWLYVTAT